MQIDYAKGLKLTNVIINGKIAEAPAGPGTK
jgi:hypothetical protein